MRAPPTTVDEFRRRLIAVIDDIGVRGHTDESAAEFAAIHKNVCLSVALGPTRAMETPNREQSNWPGDFDFEFYGVMLQNNTSSLAPLFMHDSWGTPTLSSFKAIVDGHNCPGLRVIWPNPMVLVHDYQMRQSECETIIEAMISGLCIVLAVAWNKWRIDFV